MAGDNYAIDVRDVRKTYREGVFRRRRVDALRGVTLSVGRGAIFGLLGPNGAGKTTLIKVLLGIVRRSGGDARLLGFPAGHRRGRAQVGYLPESHRIPQHLTANSALEYYGRLSGMSHREIRAERPALLERVGLGRWGDTSVRKFSKGMLQRLGLAQALLHNPVLLILDEPTDGVDPVGRSEMRELLQRLRAENKTIFINSHLLQEVELICDQVAIMHQGQLRHVGTVDELTQQARGSVAFRLSGDSEKIKTLVDAAKLARCQQLSGDAYQVEVSIDQEQEIDAYVDRFRAADIGVRSITARRRTLEEAFLDIINTVPTAAEVLD